MGIYGDNGQEVKKEIVKIQGDSSSAKGSPPDLVLLGELRDRESCEQASVA